MKVQVLVLAGPLVNEFITSEAELRNFMSRYMRKAWRNLNRLADPPRTPQRNQGKTYWITGTTSMLHVHKAQPGVEGMALGTL